MEALASEMVLPLLTGALPALAVTITSGAEQAPGDRARCLQCAYLVCKIVHRCTRSYMPSSLHAALSSSESGDRSGATPTLLALLGGIGASLRGKSNSNASGASELEGRLAKRILQLLNNLQVRHEATVIGHLSALLDTVWGCLESSGGGGGKGLPDLLAALCLDVVAASAEVPSLRIDVFERCVKSLPTVLLPLLRVARSDRELWFDDPDEFVGRNLELDLEGVIEAASSKMADGELTSARKSTIALLEAMIRDDDERRKAAAEASGSGSGSGSGKKGKKGGEGGSGRKRGGKAKAGGGGGGGGRWEGRAPPSAFG